MQTNSFTNKELSYITDEVKLILKQEASQRKVSGLSLQVASHIYDDYLGKFVPAFYATCFDFFDGLYEIGGVTRPSIEKIVSSAKYHRAYKVTEELMMDYHRGKDISSGLLEMFVNEAVCTEMVEEFMEKLNE